MKIILSLLVSALLAVQPAIADQATKDAIDDLNDHCKTNTEGCATVFGSISATVLSPIYFLLGATFSDLDLSSEPFEGIAAEMQRVRPDASDFFQSDGEQGNTALLAESMGRLRKRFPALSNQSDLQIAEMIVFSNFTSAETAKSSS